MKPGIHKTPPLSPALIAGLPLRTVPLGLFKKFTDAAMRAMTRRHPGVFERIEELGEVEFLIDPVDLPISFVMRFGEGNPELSPVRDEDYHEEPTATIHGPLMVLIDLLEGRIDGDAVFFSRGLTIEGDTTAVLTLRNALDSDEIDVAEDILSLLGPARSPVRSVFGVVGTLFRRASEDLEMLRAAAIAPVSYRCDRQASEFRELEEKVDGMPRRIKKQMKSSASGVEA